MYAFPTIPLLSTYLTEIYTPRDIQKYVYSNIVCTSLKLKTTQTPPTVGWINCGFYIKWNSVQQ